MCYFDDEEGCCCGGYAEAAEGVCYLCFVSKMGVIVSFVLEFDAVILKSKSSDPIHSAGKIALSSGIVCNKTTRLMFFNI